MECHPNFHLWPNIYAFLHIKAGLLEKLYSLPPSGSDSPDQLQWSLALSNQVYRVLQYWRASEKAHSVDDQAFIITPLAKLLEVLVAAYYRRTQPGSDQSVAVQQISTAAHGSGDASITAAASVNIQIDRLVMVGALQELGRPFSQEFRATQLSSPDILDENEWRNGLAKTIDKVARVNPQLAASQGRIPHPEMIAFYKSLPESYDKRTEMLDLVMALNS
ncbi:hypothetical protein FRC07_014524 [Ceratobasidium sp. 392]|nr:hypothetical protein FRC07_014524 [Ceratobasidium sp. 392]